MMTLLDTFRMVTLAPGWVELPSAYGDAVLAKGAGHKYIKRVPKAGGGYRYFYHVGHGGGVHAEDHMVEGAAFKHEGGHYHIAKVDGDKLTIRHDETGKTESVTKAQLRGMLAEHHGKALEAHHAKVTARAQARVRKSVKPVPTTGTRTVVFFSGKNGQPEDHAATWRVVEADEIHASHLPSSGFKRNPAYPEGVQERVYHSDKAEQEKVLSNADRFRPEMVHNTNPDSVNGAPVVTEDGIVLGGNSRTMSIKRLYDTGRGDKVKSHLIEQAHQFGLDKKAIEGMKAPILVREISGVKASETPAQDLRVLVRKANESFTQGMDPRADQVARALNMSDAAIDSMAANLGEDETIGDFLGKKSRAQSEFIEKLRASGAIDRRNESQYLRANGTLNEDGRAYVTKLFVGKVLPDPYLLSELPASTLNSIARAAPYILSARAQGQKYDLTNDLRHAVEAMVDMDIHGSKDLDAHLGQSAMDFGDSAHNVGNLAIRNSPSARTMYEVLKRNPGPNQMASVFQKFANFAKKHPEGQSDMFGDVTTAHDVLKAAAMKKGNAVYYGPHGGKYSDPGHKHAWKWTPDEKGGEQSDWVGDESDAARSARQRKIGEAVVRVRQTHAANKGNPKDSKAAEAHRAALFRLGKLVSAGHGSEAGDAALRWLRARGENIKIHTPRKRQVPRVEQGSLL